MACAVLSEHGRRVRRKAILRVVPVFTRTVLPAAIRACIQQVFLPGTRLAEAGRAVWTTRQPTASWIQGQYSLLAPVPPHAFTQPCSPRCQICSRIFMSFRWLPVSICGVTR